MSFTRMGNHKITLTQFANRAVWVKALLSGDYAQGRRRLRILGSNDEFGQTNDQWCCLGVAGHCLEPGADFVSGDPNEALLPIEWAATHLGFDTQNGQLVAARWNDQQALSFASIADRIALATDKDEVLSTIEHVTPPELIDETPGDYAREWLARQV